MSDSAALPPLYAGWIDRILDAPIAAETAATCGDCAMLPAADETGSASDAGSGQFFHPLIKCCTYLPEIPNYLVGQILDDTDPDDAAIFGRATIHARIDSGVSITPLGLGRTPVHALLYRNGALAFGKSLTLRCPHYVEEGGRCGVWRHRAAVCATWFCKYDRGAVGMSFWRSLHQLLAALETSLSRACVHSLGVGEEALSALFPPPRPGGGGSLDAHAIDGTANPALQKRLWGHWHGRESAFYRAAASHVASLTFEEIISQSGPEVRIAIDLVRAAHRRALSTELPPTLKPGSFRLIQIGKKTDRVVGYNAYDPLDLPSSVVRALRHFDGRPTAQAMQSVVDEEGIRIAPSVIRQLTDFGILVP